MLKKNIVIWFISSLLASARLSLAVDVILFWNLLEFKGQPASEVEEKLTDTLSSVYFPD